MGTPWEVSCAGCGKLLAYAFSSAPHQLYCEHCAFAPEEPVEEPSDESVS